MEEVPAIPLHIEPCLFECCSPQVMVPVGHLDDDRASGVAEEVQSRRDCGHCASAPALVARVIFKKPIGDVGNGATNSAFILGEELLVDEQLVDVVLE